MTVRVKLLLDVAQALSLDSLEKSLSTFATEMASSAMILGWSFHSRPLFSKP